MMDKLTDKLSSEQRDWIMDKFIDLIPLPHGAKHYEFLDTLIINTTKDEKKQKDCYWRHDEKEEGWVTSCSPFIFKKPPAEYCPKCGGFIVIDFYGKHTGLQQEE
jgi:hypothetical protein